MGLRSMWYFSALAIIPMQSGKASKTFDGSREYLPRDDEEGKLIHDGGRGHLVPITEWNKSFPGSALDVAHDTNQSSIFRKYLKFVPRKLGEMTRLNLEETLMSNGPLGLPPPEPTCDPNFASWPRRKA